MLKRIFDITASATGLILLSPLLLVISIMIKMTAAGTVFYTQTRVGREGVDFSLYKFRTMVEGAETRGLLTVGKKDSRVTAVGHYLRKYKLDELPQLFNVLIGDMSIVGPRPEVRKYVEKYNAEQRKVLTVKPGITDFASIEYSNENEILGRSENPEEVYLNEILPAKLKLNLKYISEKNFITDFGIILKTLTKIFL